MNFIHISQINNQGFDTFLLPLVDVFYFNLSPCFVAQIIDHLQYSGTTC